MMVKEALLDASKMRLSSPKAKLHSKKKYSETDEGNSPEIKSNKRAKLMPLAKQPELEPEPEPEPELELELENEMSDSDDTSSLTRLNTTLNKSMALMQNESETVKLNKGMKSVSINTKQNLQRLPNDSRARKSILKKPESIVTDDIQEQTIQSINIAPKIIKRPINLQNLKDQESLAYDSTKASFELEDISDNDEIYIIDIPRTVDPREFKGQTLRLGGKSKLQIRDQLYKTCDKGATNISCVFRTADEKQNSYQTVNLRPAGCINIRQKLSNSFHIELTPFEKRAVPFPKNLKIRHPLFGAEYKDKIAITNENVPNRTQMSVIKGESRVKANKTSKIDRKPLKSKNVVKHKNQNTESSEELNKSKNNSTNKVGKSQELHSDDSESSGSEFDESFFQQVKREGIEKPEKRKKSKNLLSILKLNQTPLTTDPPVQSDETMITVKEKQLSVNKKLGLSLNSSVMRNNSFDSMKGSEFFSSTPIKVENNEEEF